MISAYLGIDISKEKFDCILLCGDNKKFYESCTNDSKGFTKLRRWLKSKKLETNQVHACMEATGIYSIALAEFLYNENFFVSVVNPLQIKYFGVSELARNKNDRIDAQLIARFCQKMTPTCWKPKSEDMKQFQEHVSRLKTLSNLYLQEGNHLRTTSSKSIQKSIKKVMKLLKQEMEQIEEEIITIMNTNSKLKKQAALLSSIPGISTKTSYTFLSCIDIDDFEDGRQVAAFIGLTPRQRLSGSSVRGSTHLSKIGSTAQRSALFMPALSSIRCNPVLKRFYNELVKRGKPGKVAVGAVMRKLVHIMFSVLKMERPFFDPKTQKLCKS